MPGRDNLLDFYGTDGLIKSRFGEFWRNILECWFFAGAVQHFAAKSGVFWCEPMGVTSMRVSQ